MVATDGEITVVLDTTLNEELILEGLSREVVSAAQAERKTLGLAVSDRITMSWNAEGQLAQAIALHSEHIAGEILALEITQDASLEIPQTKGEGIALGLKLTKA